MEKTKEDSFEENKKLLREQQELMEENLASLEEIASLKDSKPKIAGQEIIKTSLLAFGIVVCSISWLWLICFNEAHYPLCNCIASLLVIAVLSIISVSAFNKDIGDGIAVMIILTAILGLSGGSTNPTSLPEFIHWPLSIILSGLTLCIIVFAGYNKEYKWWPSKRFYYIPSMVTFAMLGIIVYAGVVPLSKYHNINQLEKDKKLVEMLQIVPDFLESTEIVLPSKHISEHRYLSNVFSIITTGPDSNDVSWSWKERAIFCTEGEEKWYKMRISPSGTEEKITFLFRHRWQNHEEIKKVPAP